MAVLNDTGRDAQQRRKAMTDQILNLAEKAANYKRGGNHLLKAIGKVQDALIDLFADYSQFRFVDEPVAFLNNLASSNIGAYGPALVYVQPYHNEINRERYKPMPPNWQDAGSGFYLHNDFHVWIDYATRSDIIKAATGLVAFLKSLAAFLDEKGAINDKSATEIEKIVNSLRDAIG